MAEAPHHFQAGKDVLQNYAHDCEEFAIYLAETTEAVMGVKAPSTILSREMAIKRYILWTRVHEEQTWPMDEPIVFQYVKHLRMEPPLQQAHFSAQSILCWELWNPCSPLK